MDDPGLFVIDPSAVQGDEATRLSAFRSARDTLCAREADLLDVAG